MSVMRSAYESVASEYYDTALHPTCANFDELSRKFLEPRIREHSVGAKLIAEVGAGRSIVAPVIVDQGFLSSLLLIDNSARMLSYSQNWMSMGASHLIRDAEDTGLENEAADLLVASLGDPYNTSKFWTEASRILKQDGVCLFTTPSTEWVQRFRSPTRRSEAEFLLRDGKTVFVPSFVPNADKQIEIMSESGFHIEEIQKYFVSDISGFVSPKLLDLEGGASLAVLCGFYLRKRRR